MFVFGACIAAIVGFLGLRADWLGMHGRRMGFSVCAHVGFAYWGFLDRGGAL